MDIWIKIKTLFENTGAKESSAAVEKLGEKTADAGKAAKDAQGNTEKAFSAINASAQVAEGGVVGVGNAVRALAGQFPALNAAIAPVGLALAAFAAWKKVVDELHERQSSFNEALRDIKVGNMENDLRRLVSAYNELTKSISDAEDARKSLSNAEASKDDARTAADLAKIDLEHQQGLAQLNPGDEFARRRLELQTEQKRASVTDAAALRKSDRDLSDIKGDGNTQKAIALSAQVQQFEMERKFSLASAQQSEIINRIKEESDSKLTPKGKQDAYIEGTQKATPKLDRLAAAMKEAADGIKEAVVQQAAAEREIYSLSEKAEVNRMSRDTQLVRSQTGSVSRMNEQGSITRDASIERERLQKELRSKLDQEGDIKGRQQDLRSKAFKEYDDVRKVRRTGSGNMDKEMREWQDAAKALSDYADKSTKVLSDLRADMEKVKEAIKNLPVSSN